MIKTIFHLDLDAFFVSVERILDPSLEGKPVIVGADPSKGRGVISACSYEARKYGLHSAMPINQAYKLCPFGIYLSGNHRDYGRFSHSVKKILEKYAPVIEQASIDEFYMDFTGCSKIYGNLFQFAGILQKEIWDTLSLPCSIGIGSTRTIAKICSDFNKPKGITYILPGMEKEFLKKLPAEKLPGIGKVTIKDLNAKGFYTLGDIAAFPEDYFITAFGKHGSDLWRKANGEGSSFLNPPAKRKSISKERTYAEDVLDKNEIERTLFDLAGKVCQVLREKNWLTSTVGIKLRYSDFNTLTRAKTIKPTDDDKIIYEETLKLFRNAFTRRVAVRLIGIHLSNFSKFNEQEVLFEDENIVRKKMLRAVTKIRDKYGYSSLKIGTN